MRHHKEVWKKIFKLIFILTLSWRRSLSYRNQSIDLFRKICGENQWTCFYMITASVMKGLIQLSKMHRTGRVKICFFQFMLYLFQFAAIHTTTRFFLSLTGVDSLISLIKWMLMATSKYMSKYKKNKYCFSNGRYFVSLN